MGGDGWIVNIAQMFTNAKLLMYQYTYTGFSVFLSGLCTCYNYTSFCKSYCFCLSKLFVFNNITKFSVKIDNAWTVVGNDRKSYYGHFCLNGQFIQDLIEWNDAKADGVACSELKSCQFCKENTCM